MPEYKEFLFPQALDDLLLNFLPGQPTSLTKERKKKKGKRNHFHIFHMKNIFRTL